MESKGKKPEYVLYVVLNSDLKMRAGRAAAQVGHVVNSLTELVVKNSYDPHVGLVDNSKVDLKIQQRYLSWHVYDAVIVIVQATQTELEALRYLPESVAFWDKLRCENGQTEETKEELTCVAFFPREKQDIGPKGEYDFSGFKLY